MMKKIKYWLYNIDYWCYMHLWIYINFYDLFTILSEWWQCRDVFKFPKININKESICNNNNNKIFSINVYRLGWKWKWDEVRFESDPRIEITIFNKWRYYILFISPAVDRRGNPDENMYWETMLEYLYMYKKDFKKTYDKFGWTSCDFVKYEGEEYDIAVPQWNWNCFTDEAIKKYLKMCKAKEITIHKIKY